jgi:squalene-associated FAD-dependent desaturase
MSGGHAPHVAVVGGGLAGITAALDCAAAGVRVTLLEVRPRLGGAAYSYERDGLRLDNGQHVFLRCCGAYRALLRRIGAEGDVVLQPRLDIPVLVPGKRPARLRRSRLRAPLQLTGSMARLPLLSVAEKARVARAMLALREIDPDDGFADARPFGDWLDEQQQGPAEVEAVWRLIGLPTLNVEPAEASLAQAAYVFRTALLEHNNAADIGWSRVPLSDLHDGPSRRALAAAGAEVRLGARIERVVARPGGGFLVEGPSDGVEADAVVVAVPVQRAAALLPAGALADPGALERLGRSPIVNLHVAYDRRVLDEPFAVGVRSPVQWIFDRTAGSGLERGQLVAVSLSAADEEAAMDADALRERFVPALAALLPAAREARVERFLVTREHAATFRPGPGARTLRPGARTAVPGLVLAGTYTDTGWPATMESAVRSGHAAAREALAAARPTAPMQAVAA